ncbi:MAG: 3-deoxy-8-phosphooctulonate synthase [Alphaproteobacteria bacterium]|nr:3-deoxy-8-phosphooctulonate synthase [Alphaproteobacteria bacterium]MBN2780072.1 3-deoxy-8-phosphooctulonate synthase [Alphaproteobacteria bacterium]
MHSKHIKINDTITLGNDLPFVLIAGPCAMENRDHAIMMATEIKKITDELGIPYIFKSSFDKANRSSITSKRGFGKENAMPVFDEIREKLGIPCITDIHLPSQAEEVAKHVDLLQIPAFLARQQDLLIAAAKTGKTVNVKKPQFLAPHTMKNVVKIMQDSGNDRTLLTERGTLMGYGDYVVDYRGIAEMKETGYPVVIDATHSVQTPSTGGTCSGGARQYVPTIAHAAVIQGIAAVFLEVHQEPEIAPCDGPNMVRLSQLKDFLSNLKKIDELAKSLPEVKMS